MKSKRMKLTPNPYTENYGHQHCWNEGYRQALFDLASHIITSNENSSLLAIDIAQQIVDAMNRTDPRNKHIKGNGNPHFCEHANECPLRCPCKSNCYCRGRTCHQSKD